jgi:hypothetical protein
MRIKTIFCANLLLLALSADATDLNPIPDIIFEPSITTPQSTVDRGAL